MAAYAALASLMHIIHAIENHPSPPISIHSQQAQSLTQLITSLQQFLQDYTPPATEIDVADPLEMRIAATAYSAEDIIESRIVNQIHRRTGIFVLFNCFRAPKKLEYIPLSELERVIEEMESINKLTVGIDTQNQLLRSAYASASTSRSISARQNSITVFSDNVVNEVMEKLVWGSLNRHAIPIVGMGGIGKTTLARNVYTHQTIIQHFDILAWATISQQYNTIEILCQLLSQATNQDREELSKKSEDQLETMFYQCLCGRSYLIVLDDMWSIDAWNTIQLLLPKNANGSRVLVTTRISELSSQLNENNSLHMKFLDEASSWDLFSKTVFEEESCPTELEGIGKKIVENCRGLPLSIVVVGGILKKMDRSRGSWESIGKNLSSLVNLENDKHCLRLLGLSYNHLPAHLKPCFLYMGVFEEDSEIKVSKLIKLWVCEGFLKPTSDDSMETTAREFLRDLVDRNLILVHELGSTGNIKFCKIHDFLRDFCMNQSKKEGFYHVIGQSSPQGINGHRRVVIPRNTLEKKVRDDLRSMSHVRSVISEKGNVPSCWNLKLLRVVDAYTCNCFYYGRSHLNHRYLEVVYLDIMSSALFFSSVSLYWNLHTLIVSSPDGVVPIEIWKMTHLSHIQFGMSLLFLPDPPRDGVVMKNLQVLKGLKKFKFSERVVERIPNIKKLEVRYYGDDEESLKKLEGDDCLSNVQRLCKLESLDFWLIFKKDCPNFLSKLTFPHSLKKLFLGSIGTTKVNDLLEKIGSLPHLEKFKLRDSKGGCFPTGEWEVVEGQFPRLKYLEVDFCIDLKKLTTQEGSVIFPRLEQLRLSVSIELEEIPYEIGEIATLKRIELNLCNALAVRCAKGIVDEQVELQGELPFHVQVTVDSMNEELLSLTGPYFHVSVQTGVFS